MLKQVMSSSSPYMQKGGRIRDTETAAFFVMNINV